MTGIKHIFDILDKILKVLIITICLVMIAAAFLQVVSREFFPTTWTWTDELSRYCMIWMTYLAGGLGVRYRSHVRIDTLLKLVPDAVKKGLEVLAIVCEFIFGGFIANYGFQLCVKNMTQHSASMHISMGYVYLAVPIGGVLIFLFAIEDVIRLCAGRCCSAEGGA